MWLFKTYKVGLACAGLIFCGFVTEDMEKHKTLDRKDIDVTSGFIMDLLCWWYSFEYRDVIFRMKTQHLAFIGCAWQ